MTAFDPESIRQARLLLPGVELCAAAADALVMLTEWEAYRSLDLPRMKAQLAAAAVVDLAYLPPDFPINWNWFGPRSRNPLLDRHRTVHSRALMKSNSEVTAARPRLCAPSSYRFLQMCGIVGIIGREPVAERLVEALRRLEYRGYDSAGVATLEADGLQRRRAEGKLRNLEARLRVEPLNGLLGIGHTRWATHGRPTENNAHPHATKRLAVVHNGIIENFRELRAELTARGHSCVTETDTEVVAHLVTDGMDAGLSPREAVAKALPRLRGAFVGHGTVDQSCGRERRR